MPIPFGPASWQQDYMQMQNKLLEQEALRERLAATRQEQAQEYARQNALVDLYNQQKRQAYEQQYEPAFARFKEHEQLTPGPRLSNLPPAYTPPAPMTYPQIAAQEYMQDRQLKEAKAVEGLYGQALSEAIKSKNNDAVQGIVSQIDAYQQRTGTVNPYITGLADVYRGLKLNTDGSIQFSGTVTDTVISAAKTMAPGNPMAQAMVADLERRKGQSAEVDIDPAKGIFKVKETGVSGVSGVAGQRAINEAQRMVKAGEAASVQEALPQAAENVKQKDEEAKEQRRIADEERRVKYQIDSQMRQFEFAMRRMDRMQDTAVMRTYMRGPVAAEAKMRQTYATASRLEMKLIDPQNGLIPLTRKLIAKYEKEHPAVVRSRGAAWVNDLWSGKLKAEGDLLAIKRNLNEIEAENGRLATGAFTNAATTKAAMDKFSQIKTGQSAESIKTQLDNLEQTTKIAADVEFNAANNAVEEFNSAASEFGLPPKPLIKKRGAEASKPQGDISAVRRNPNYASAVSYAKRYKRGDAAVIADIKAKWGVDAGNAILNEAWGAK